VRQHLDVTDVVRNRDELRTPKLADWRDDVSMPVRSHEGLSRAVSDENREARLVRHRALPVGSQVAGRKLEIRRVQAQTLDEARHQLPLRVANLHRELGEPLEHQLTDRYDVRERL
jgi:hypothetical protein